MVQHGGEISWDVSSTKPKDSLLLRFIPMVRFFIPYKVRFDGEIFLEASFMIIPGALEPLIGAMDRIFAPHRVKDT